MGNSLSASEDEVLVSSNVSRDASVNHTSLASPYPSGRQHNPVVRLTSVQSSTSNTLRRTQNDNTEPSCSGVEPSAQFIPRQKTHLPSSSSSSSCHANSHHTTFVTSCFPCAPLPPAAPPPKHLLITSKPPSVVQQSPVTATCNSASNSNNSINSSAAKAALDVTAPDLLRQLCYNNSINNSTVEGSSSALQDLLGRVCDCGQLHCENNNSGKGVSLSTVFSRAACSSQWWELWDGNTQRYYYFNTFTRQTVWHRPDTHAADIIPLAKIQALQLASQTQNSNTNGCAAPSGAFDVATIMNKENQLAMDAPLRPLQDQTQHLSRSKQSSCHHHRRRRNHNHLMHQSNSMDNPPDMIPPADLSRATSNYLSSSATPNRTNSEQNRQNATSRHVHRNSSSNQGSPSMAGAGSAGVAVTGTGKVFKPSSRLLRSSCFGCSVPKCHSCTQDNKHVPPVPERVSNDSNTVSQSSAASTSSQSHSKKTGQHHHHHHRCNKHKRYTQHSYHTQTQTVLDEATREIINRSLANNSPAVQNNFPHVAARPDSGINQMDATRAETPSNQPCMRHHGVNPDSPHSFQPPQRYHTCSHDKATPPLPRKAAPPLPRAPHPAAAENPALDFTKPQNVLAVENRNLSKLKSQMPLPNLNETSSGAPQSGNTPPFSNYGVQGSTPSPSSVNNNSPFLSGRDQRSHNQSPHPQTNPSIVSVSCTSPNPFERTTNVTVPRTHAPSQFFASNAVHIEPKNNHGPVSEVCYTPGHSDHRPNPTSLKNPKSRQGQTKSENKSSCKLMRSMTPQLGYSCNHHNAQGVNFSLSNSANTNSGRLQTSNNLNFSSDQLSNPGSARKEDFPFIDKSPEQLFDSFASPQLPFRNCKSYQDLLSENIFVSEVQIETENYSEEYENLRAGSMSTDALYENTPNARNPDQCNCSQVPLNPLNPFLQHCCKRKSLGSQDVFIDSCGTLDNLGVNDVAENVKSLMPENCETYETLTNYTSSYPESPMKNANPGFSNKTDVSLMGRIYDHVANSDEDANLIDGMDNLEMEENKADRTLMFEDEDADDDFADEEDDFLGSEDVEYVNTSGATDAVRRLHSIGAKFTPPSSRDILAAVDSKLGQVRASCNSPARPPKSSNLEMIESWSVASAGNNNRASVYSHDSAMRSPSKTSSHAHSSKESMLSSGTSESSERGKAADLTNAVHPLADQREASSGFHYQTFGSASDTLSFRVESEAVLSLPENQGVNGTPSSHTCGLELGGTEERTSLMPIYDQPCGDHDYLFYDSRDASDAGLNHESPEHQHSRSAVYENYFRAPQNGSSMSNSIESSLQSDSCGLLARSLDNVDSQLVHQQQQQQQSRSSPFSRGVNASGAVLDLTRKSGLFKKKQSTSDVMKWTKEVLRDPLIADRRYKRDAVECFKLIQTYMGDRKPTSSSREDSSGVGGGGETAQLNCALELVLRGLETPQLRDELILQVCKQSIDNSKQSSVRQGWELFAIFFTFFAPSDKILSYVEHFLQEYADGGDGVSDEDNGGGASLEDLSFHQNEDEVTPQVPNALSTTLEKMCSIPVKKFALHCWKQLNRIVASSEESCLIRKHKPTIEEVLAARNGLHQLGLFGSCLSDLMDTQRESEAKSVSCLSVPWILQTLVTQIVSRKAHTLEGILRVSGDADVTQRLKCELNSYPACKPPDSDKFWANYDSHVLAGLLKQWLRQLDEPLIPLQLYNQIISHVSKNDIQALLKLVNHIGEPNKTVLHYLVAFLQLIVDESDSNKMTSHNTALVIAPNCLWSQSRDPQTMLQNSQFESSVIQALIDHMDTSDVKSSILSNAL